MKTIILALVSVAAASQAAAAIVASDNLESNSTSGGGGWASAWAISGGNYINSGSLIDGTYSLGLFGQGNLASRLVSPTVSTSGDTITIGWSLRAGWDVVNDGDGNVLSEIGLNIINAASSPLLTMKFVEGGSSLLMNDGGADFARTGITFFKDSVYDFTFSSVMGSNAYSFSVSRDNGLQTDSGTGFTYQGGRTTNSIGGVQMFATAPTGSGNDGFLDSVSVDVVPEPSQAALFGLGALGLALRRRR